MYRDVVGEKTVRLDSLFDALGNEHRLRVLVTLYLADPGEEFQAEDLVAPGEDRQRIVTSFYHVHFPKLERLGLVEWDREENSVVRGGEFEAVDQLLDCLVVRDDEVQAGLLGHEV